MFPKVFQIRMDLVKCLFLFVSGDLYFHTNTLSIKRVQVQTKMGGETVENRINALWQRKWTANARLPTELDGSRLTEQYLKKS